MPDERLTRRYLRQLIREDDYAAAEAGRSRSRPPARSRSRPGGHRGTQLPPTPSEAGGSQSGRLLASAEAAVGARATDPVVPDCVLCMGALEPVDAVAAWPHCGHTGHVQCIVRHLRRLPEEPAPELRGSVLVVERHLQAHLLPPHDWLAQCACPMRGNVSDRGCGLGVEACLQRWGDPDPEGSVACRSLEGRLSRRT